MHETTDTIWAAAESGKGHRHLTAENLIEIGNRAGTSGLHIAAYFGSLKTIMGGVTAEQMFETRDCMDGSALRVAALRGHIDQIEGGVTAEHLLTDPTTQVCLISPRDWGDHNTSVDMTTMRLLERAIEASHPTNVVSLIGAVRGPLPPQLRKTLLGEVKYAKAQFSETATPALRLEMALNWQKLVNLCRERKVPVVNLTPEAAAELL